jgi:hypothetical protein
MAASSVFQRSSWKFDQITPTTVWANAPSAAAACCSEQRIEQEPAPHAHGKLRVTRNKGGYQPNEKRATEGDPFRVPWKLSIGRKRLMFERPELFRQQAA